MDMNFDFITPSLAVGQKIDSPELVSALLLAGVQRVINLWSGNPEPLWVGDILTLKQEDDGTSRDRDQVLAGVRYANAVPDRILYVHCQWGLGRAPAMAYAILRSRGWSRGDAQALINLKRPRAATGGWERYIPSIEEALTQL